MVQVARAVHFAHQRGVLHRDLKPANILLDRQDTPYVSDFGLAKRTDGDSGQTQSGTILGTPSYMAPEQARAEKVITTAADVYGLGAILYEMLTGCPPFRAATPLDTVLQVLDREPQRPRAIDAAIDRDLETIALKCLAKEPGRRYESAAALADDLERWRQGVPILARPSTRRERLVKWARRNPALAALAAVSFAAAVALLVVGLVFDARLRVALGDAQSQQALAGQAREAAEEERTAAAAAHREARRLLADGHVSEGWRRLEQGEWGNALVFFAQAIRAEPEDSERQQTHRVRFRTVAQRFPRPLQLLRHDTMATSAAFTPDGKLLMTTTSDGVTHFWDADRCKPVAVLPAVNGGLFDARLSPDGRRVATAAGDGTAQVWEVPSGRPLVSIRHEGQPVHGVAFSPDGRLLATAGAKRACLWDTDSGKLRASLKYEHGVARVAFNSDGSLLLGYWPGGSFHVHGDPRGELRIWDVASGKLVTRLPGDDKFRHAEFSADGKRVITASDAAVHMPERARVWDTRTGKEIGPGFLHGAGVEWASLFVGRAAVSGSSDKTARVWDATTGAALGPPLPHADTVRFVGFSPDIGHVLTVAGDVVRIWDRRSGEPLTPPLPHPRRVLCAEFSPDGRRLAVASGTDVLVWEANPRARAIRTLAEAGDFLEMKNDPGAQLTFEFHGKEVRVKDRAGRLAGPPLKHASAPISAKASADGRRVMTESFSFAGGRSTIRVWDVRTGEPVGPALDLAGVSLSTALSRDGDRVLGVAVGSVFAWETASGKRLGPELRHGSTGVHTAVFSPNGRWIVTTDMDNTSRVWDVQSGQLLAPPFFSELAVTRLQPDGRSLRLTRMQDQLTIEEWDFTPDTRPVEDLELLAALLAGQRFVPIAGLTALDTAEIRSTWDRQLRPSLHPQRGVHLCQRRCSGGERLPAPPDVPRHADGARAEQREAGGLRSGRSWREGNLLHLLEPVRIRDGDGFNCLA
jgi:WD40 repeat protein